MTTTTAKLQQLRQKAKTLTPAERYITLSKRERPIAHMIAADQSNKEIAFNLDIKIKTVEKHRGSINCKLDTVSALGVFLVLFRAGAIKL